MIFSTLFLLYEACLISTVFSRHQSGGRLLSYPNASSFFPFAKLRPSSETLQKQHYIAHAASESKLSRTEHGYAPLNCRSSLCLPGIRHDEDQRLLDENSKDLINVILESDAEQSKLEEQAHLLNPQTFESGRNPLRKSPGIYILEQKKLDPDSPSWISRYSPLSPPRFQEYKPYSTNLMNKKLCKISQGSSQKLRQKMLKKSIQPKSLSVARAKIPPNLALFDGDEMKDKTDLEELFLDPFNWSSESSHKRKIKHKCKQNKDINTAKPKKLEKSKGSKYKKNKGKKTKFKVHNKTKESMINHSKSSESPSSIATQVKEVTSTAVSEVTVSSVANTLCEVTKGKSESHTGKSTTGSTVTLHGSSEFTSSVELSTIPVSEFASVNAQNVKIAPNGFENIQPLTGINVMLIDISTPAVVGMNSSFTDNIGVTLVEHNVPESPYDYNLPNPMDSIVSFDNSVQSDDVANYQYQANATATAEVENSDYFANTNYPSEDYNLSASLTGGMHSILRQHKCHISKLVGAMEHYKLKSNMKKCLDDKDAKKQTLSKLTTDKINKIATSTKLPYDKRIDSNHKPKISHEDKEELDNFRAFLNKAKNEKYYKKPLKSLKGKGKSSPSPGKKMVTSARHSSIEVRNKKTTGRSTREFIRHYWMYGVAFGFLILISMLMKILWPQRHFPNTFSSFEEAACYPGGNGGGKSEKLVLDLDPSEGHHKRDIMSALKRFYPDYRNYGSYSDRAVHRSIRGFTQLQKHQTEGTSTPSGPCPRVEEEMSSKSQSLEIKSASYVYSDRPALDIYASPGNQDIKESDMFSTLVNYESNLFSYEQCEPMAELPNNNSSSQNPTKDFKQVAKQTIINKISQVPISSFDHSRKYGHPMTMPPDFTSFTPVSASHKSPNFLGELETNDSGKRQKRSEKLLNKKILSLSYMGSLSSRFGDENNLNLDPSYEILRAKKVLNMEWPSSSSGDDCRTYTVTTTGNISDSVKQFESIQKIDPADWVNLNRLDTAISYYSFSSDSDSNFGFRDIKDNPLYAGDSQKSPSFNSLLPNHEYTRSTIDNAKLSSNVSNLTGNSPDHLTWKSCLQDIFYEQKSCDSVNCHRAHPRKPADAENDNYKPLTIYEENSCYTCNVPKVVDTNSCLTANGDDTSEKETYTLHKMSSEICHTLKSFNHSISVRPYRSYPNLNRNNLPNICSDFFRLSDFRDVPPSDTCHTGPSLRNTFKTR